VDLIGEACARNVPAELHLEDTAGNLTIGRVRLLEMTDDLVLTDRPTMLDDNAVIPVGSTLTVHFALNGSRYQFESLLKESGLIVRLNAHQRVAGISLRQPLELTDSQRRLDMRVSVLGNDSLNIWLVDPHPSVSDACSIDARVIAGQIVDISCGGVSVLVPHEALRKCEPGQRFYLNFLLPAVEYKFCMLGNVRFSRLVECSGSIRLGIQFQRWNGSVHQRDRQRISRFVVAHERQRLKRRR
jgi:c-di-GMP-binding flagellar brake protein YcgR